MAQTLNEADKNMEGCVMLALSTFRRSEKAVAVAIEKCLDVKDLMIVYVVDINVARYIVGSEEAFLFDMKDQNESELLEKAKQDALEAVAKIAKEADNNAILTKTLVKVGRFAEICLEVVKQTHPSLIVTTRSRRPDWVKKFFGAPVDELIAKAVCPVLTV